MRVERSRPATALPEADGCRRVRHGPMNRTRCFFPGDVRPLMRPGLPFRRTHAEHREFPGADKYLAADLIAAHSLRGVIKGAWSCRGRDGCHKASKGWCWSGAGIEPVDEKRRAGRTLRERFGNARVLRC